MLKVPREIVDAMFEQALQEAPRECCGLLAGRDGQVTRHYPATNADQSKTTYVIDSRELLNIYKAIDEAGLEILSVYHSHTMSEAYPSATDITRAFWEGTDWETCSGCVYLIISLAEGKEPVLRGFRIPNRDSFEEVPVTIVEESP